MKTTNKVEVNLDFAALFSSDVGKRVLANLQKTAGFDNTGFHPENERMTSFNLGKKDMVFYIIKQIQQGLK